MPKHDTVVYQTPEEYASSKCEWEVWIGSGDAMRAVAAFRYPPANAEGALNENRGVVGDNEIRIAIGCIAILDPRPFHSKALYRWRGPGGERAARHVASLIPQAAVKSIRP